jgi:7-keto-8-aminopelargonate synthetase-like enzyme
MDGDAAPLRELRALADRYDAALLGDEAHSLGVLGAKGQGLCAATPVVPDVLIGTLGKSFGLAGACVAGPEATVELVLQRARSFVFSTAPLPALAAAIPTACALVSAADDRRQRVLRHADRIRAALRALDYRAGGADSPIVPVLVGEADPTMALSTGLLEQGVFVQGIRPPTVPRGTSRLRLVPTAAHTDAHVDRLVEAFARVRPT